MTWQTPKTDWKSANIVLSSDLNRIEGNINELNNTKLDKTGDAKDTTVTFTDTNQDGQITSGNKLSALISLIKYKLSSLNTTLQQIADGTIRLGDADTVDGKHASDFYQFVPKRSSSGDIVYMIEAQHDTEQSHSYGTARPGQSGSHDFAILTLNPSFKKRFLEITFEYYTTCEIGSYPSSKFQLINVSTGETLKEANVTRFGVWRSVSYRNESIVVNPGSPLQFRIRNEWSQAQSSSSCYDFVVKVRNFRIYMEDMEIK